MPLHLIHCNKTNHVYNKTEVFSITYSFQLAMDQTYLAMSRDDNDPVSVSHTTVTMTPVMFCWRSMPLKHHGYMNLVSFWQEWNEGDDGAYGIGISFILTKKRDGYFLNCGTSRLPVDALTSCPSLHSNQFNHVVSQSIYPLLPRMCLEELD